MFGRSADPAWLAFMPNWVGDFLMAFASLDEFFGSFLIFAPPNFYDLIAGKYDPSLFIGRERSKLGFFKNFYAIFRSRIYRAVLFPNSFSSALLVSLCGMKRIVGLPTDFRFWLLTDRVDIQDLENLHQAEVYRKILEEAGFRYDGPIRSRVYLREEDVEWALDFMGKMGIRREETVLIHPGASKRERCWPPARFREIVSRLLRRGFKVVILGSRREADLGEMISRDLSGVIDVTRYDLPLGKLSALILNGGFIFIGNDSGPLHIASCGVPNIIGIYGPGSPKKTGPLFGESTRFIPVTRNFPCSPCRERFFRDCRPIEGLPPCIYDIGVDDVWEAIDEILL